MKNAYLCHHLYPLLGVNARSNRLDYNHCWVTDGNGSTACDSAFSSHFGVDRGLNMNRLKVCRADFHRNYAAFLAFTLGDSKRILHILCREGYSIHEAKKVARDAKKSMMVGA